ILATARRGGKQALARAFRQFLHWPPGQTQPKMTCIDCSMNHRRIADMSNAHHTRREFLAASLSGLASTLCFASQEDRPLLDVHQHSLYTGRTHEQLLTHQKLHGVTLTVLLPIEGLMMQGGSSSVTD